MCGYTRNLGTRHHFVIVTHKKWGILSNLDLSLTRGSHLYVPCRSVCDQNQNWIKRSKPFFGLIKVTSSLVSRPLIRLGDLWTAKINGSRTQGYNLTSTLWKCSRTSEGNGQVIKHSFWSKTLITVAKHEYAACDYLLHLARVHYTVINSWSLIVGNRLAHKLGTSMITVFNTKILTELVWGFYTSPVFIAT